MRWLAWHVSTSPGRCTHERGGAPAASVSGYTCLNHSYALMSGLANTARWAGVDTRWRASSGGSTAGPSGRAAGSGAAGASQGAGANASDALADGSRARRMAAHTAALSAAARFAAAGAARAKEVGAAATGRAAQRAARAPLLARAPHRSGAGALGLLVGLLGLVAFRRRSPR